MGLYVINGGNTYRGTWVYLQWRGWRCTCWWCSASACWPAPPPTPASSRSPPPGGVGHCNIGFLCCDYQELCKCYNNYHCCKYDFRVHQENCEIGHAENELNNRLKDQNLFRLTRPVIILVMVIIFVIVVIIKQFVIILVISFLSLSFLLS